MQKLDTISIPREEKHMKIKHTTLTTLFVTLAILLAACGTSLPTNTLGAATTPTRTLTLYSSENPVCTTARNQLGLNYTYGFKPNAGGAENVGGTFTNVLGVSGLTITWNYLNGTNYEIEWSATLEGQPFGIDAVIVKGGNAANVYTYTPEDNSDSGLVTPINASGGNAGVSHVEFCFDFEVAVKKTAKTSFVRTYLWDIEKSADQTDLLLSDGQVFIVNYSVTARVSNYVDTDWAVEGTISIKNPDPNNTAMITSITDNISGIGNVSVDCGGQTTIAPGGTLICTYGPESLPDGTARVNTATVTTSGKVGGGFGSADVIFGDPTTKVNECVDVTDTLVGNLGTVCADQAPKTFKYSLGLGKSELADVVLECGQSTVTNTASLSTGETSSAKVNVTVTCGGGCTLTQGYWKTHSDRGPAPYDDAWKNLGALEEDTLFFKSGKTWYTVFWTPPAGNAFYNLAHQYMAAKLNVLNGASSTTAVDSALSGAEALFNSLATGSTTLTKTQRTQALAWASTLDNYNNGIIGPGHCSE
jgi:hypothetical protein